MQRPHAVIAEAHIWLKATTQWEAEMAVDTRPWIEREHRGEAGICVREGEMCVQWGKLRYKEGERKKSC